MTNSKQKIIDDYLEKIKDIDNIEKICVSTFDGFLLKGYKLTDKDEEDMPAILSKYLSEISMFTKFSTGEDFNIGFYLTSGGFMVITALQTEAMIQVVAKGRKNVATILRLVQTLAMDYEK